MQVPPGVNRKDYSAALRQFEKVVGEEWLFTSPDSVALYKDAYSPLRGEKEEKVASAAVAPANTEQVQEVVRIANRYKIPIYPISTGKNLGYGGSAPVLSGSVVLDLKRMNRILEVNEEGYYALVEPGVSYFDLYNYIQENNLKVWIDCPDPGWGSLVGNSLDRGLGSTTTMYRDHFSAHCGMEIVLADGEVIRTGMGALPGAKTWQHYPHGFGPSVDGIFAQSNFGVVTKMGFWLMPEPEAYRELYINAYNRKDIIPLVQIHSYMENTGACNGLPYFTAPILGRDGIGRDPEHQALLNIPGGPSEKALKSYGEKNNLPWWRCKLSFYGASEVVDAQLQYAKRRYASIEGAESEEGRSYSFPMSEEDKRDAHQVIFGIPNLSVFFSGARSETNPEPTSGHIWLSLVLPRTGEAILEAQEVFGKAFAEWGLPILGFDRTPFSYIHRAFILLFNFPTTIDIETNKKNREAFRQIVKLAAEHGWGEFRTAPAFMDDVMDVYSYNNHSLLRFRETLKDAVDPNGILSAGRGGIWPKHLRGSKQ